MMPMQILKNELDGIASVYLFRHLYLAKLPAMVRIVKRCDGFVLIMPYKQEWNCHNIGISTNPFSTDYIMVLHSDT